MISEGTSWNICLHTGLYGTIPVSITGTAWHHPRVADHHFMVHKQTLQGVRWPWTWAHYMCLSPCYTPPHTPYLNPPLSLRVKLDLDSQGPVWPPPADHTMGDRLTVWVVVRVFVYVLCGCLSAGLALLQGRNIIHQTDTFFSRSLYCWKLAHLNLKRLKIKIRVKTDAFNDLSLYWSSVQQNPQWYRSLLKYL